MRITTAVIMVATRMKAGRGWKKNPSGNATPIPTMSWPMTPTYGERHRGWIRVNTGGISRIRPMAYHVLVVAFALAFEFAIAEFRMARKTRTHAAPHAALPRPVQGSPPLNPAKLGILDGPKKTVAAYVVRT